MEQVIDELNDLIEKEVVTLDSLETDERFLSVFLEISNIAIRTHDQDKKDMLKNAMSSAAKDLTKDETLESVLVSLIAQLLPIHLKNLRFARSPDQEHAKRVLLGAFAELGEDEDLVELLWGGIYITKGWCHRWILHFHSRVALVLTAVVPSSV